MNILILIGLLIFLLANLYRREWGIYLMILGLPTYQIRFQIFNIPATFLEGMILILVLAMSLRAILINDEAISIRTRMLHFIRKDRWILVFIFLFLLATGISVFVGPDFIKAAGIFKAYFFEAALFYFLVRLIIDSPEKLNKLFTALSVLVMYLSLFGIYQYLTLQNLPFTWWDVGFAERRIVSFLNHPNALALLLGPILAMQIMLPKNKLRISAVILGLVAFYLTFSRAGWLALVATLAIFGFLKFHKTLPLFLVSVAALIILFLAIPISREKLISLTRADPSKANRYVLWSAAVNMLKKQPITGMGIGGFREAYKNYPLGPDRVVQNYPHNFFLNFWVETGLLGLLSIVGLLIIFYKKIRALARNSRSRNHALAIASGMAMIVLHSLVDVSYFKNDLAILFWLIYALPNLNSLA